MQDYYYINKRNLEIEKIMNPTSLDLNHFKKITKNTKNIHIHPYHLVDPSPWPFIISFGCLFFTFGIAMYFHGYIGSNFLMFTGLLIIIFTMYTCNILVQNLNVV